MSHPRDLAASVRQRLLNDSRRRGEEFQRILIRYAIERLLYRISVSNYHDRFMLKGAMLFAVWTEEPLRGTRDLDLWGRGTSEPAELAEVFRSICAAEVEGDGIVFDADTVQAELIREENIYAGVRVRFAGDLAGARLPMQVDVGYGDTIDPGPDVIEYPTLLDMPAPRILGYPREVVVAEKLEAMATLGIANSRLKDFYDIAELSRRFDFEGERVATAIRSTFARRGSPMPAGAPAGLTAEYYEDPARQTQWRAFLRRTAATEQSVSLPSTVQQIRAFVLPVTEATVADRPFDRFWPPGGPWRDLKQPALEASENYAVATWAVSPWQTWKRSSPRRKFTQLPSIDSMTIPSKIWSPDRTLEGQVVGGHTQSCWKALHDDHEGRAV